MALPSEIDLVIGEHFRAPITGAGSQGYRWLVTVTRDAAAVAVRTVGVPPAGDSPGQGSYPRELQIDALQTGVAVVDLALTRVNGEVRERHVLTVRVVGTR
ncbi:hypothetical protein ET475_10005 [Microbacterium protaetiae]|uniref:Proteinase inhibitor I42 chagasin domain-containing protein n=1 Tax=Microbacterium protaetiae TaxID=2509458 RepID=A0A4P6EDR5_9MICO|nr:hypothetical protein [Microbacterium protaetiae]QAY60284.1 hypothetical protein ET475_10005 [Microbacterium protaetiae]